MDLSLSCENLRDPLFSELPFHIECNVNREILSAMPFFVMGEVKDWCSQDRHSGRRRESGSTNYLRTEILKRVRRSRTGVMNMIPLDLFPHLPLDIMLEILKHLHPIDMFHLSHTIRAFNELLLSPICGGLWRKAFRNSEHVPGCPTDVAGLGWAKFLFGRNVCSICGASNAMPDFALRLRLCTRCTNCLLTNKPEFIIGNIRTTSLLPSTLPRDGHFRTTPGRFFRASAKNLAIVLDSFDHASSIKGSLTSEIAFEAYLRSAQSHVTEIQEHAQMCSEWARNVKRSRDGERDSLLSRLVQKIGRRLSRAGYHEEDLECAYWELVRVVEDYLHRYNFRLTRYRWNDMRVRLEPTLLLYAQERLSRARQRLVDSRKAVVRSAFQAYKQTMLPSTWAYWPPLYTVNQWEEFSAIINSSTDDPLTTEDCAEAIKVVPRHVEEWTVEQKTQLASLLPSYTQGNASTPRAHPFAPDISPLDLATSVFECLGSSLSSVAAGRCLIGWEAAGAHMRCESLEHFWDHRLHFSQRGFDAATSLLELAGFDPRTTSASDFDREDLRFVCTHCTSMGLKGRRALTWRECVFHFTVKEKDPGHTSLAWQLLTPEITRHIMTREVADPSAKDKAWSCNHCGLHFNNFVQRSHAVEHVRMAHDIVRPVEDVDFIHFASAQRTRRVAARFNETAEYICQRCPAVGGNRRLFTAEQLVRHLHDKHKVEIPDEEADFVPVPTVLRVWPLQDPHNAGRSCPLPLIATA